MRFIKGFFLSICITLLTLSLLGTAWSYVGLKTIHSRETVKSWLTEGSFYDSAVEAALSNIKQEDGKENDIPINDPEVQAVVKTVVSPEFLKKTSESILDGVYDWLDGKTAAPTFSVDLTSLRKDLATGIGNYATRKASNLSTCSPDQITQEFDAFNATCLPPGVSAQVAGQEVSAELLGNDEFINKTTFTGDDLKVEENGKSVPLAQSEQITQIKRAYKLSALLPLILGGVSLLLAVIILFISSTKRHGIRRVGVTMLTSGAFLGITYAILTRVPEEVTKRIGTDKATDKLTNGLVQTTSVDIRAALLWFMIGFAAAGLVLIIISLVIGKKDKPAKPAKSLPAAEPTLLDGPELDSLPPELDTPEPPRETPSAPPLPKSPALPAQKPKQPPRKIQL